MKTIIIDGEEYGYLEPGDLEFDEADLIPADEPHEPEGWMKYSDVVRPSWPAGRTGRTPETEAKRQRAEAKKSVGNEEPEATPLPIQKVA